MEYQILSQHLLANLESEVAAAIADGWEPLGGVAIDGWEGGTHFYQAMVRRHKGGE